MAGLKLAMINGIKPMAGSGDGITEYAYRMQLELGKTNKVDAVYAIDRARKNDVMGLLTVNSLLSASCRAAADKDYDVFHIVNQEVGFAAKDIKSVESKDAVVTTIHDLSRFQSGINRGALQKAYNAMVQGSIAKAVDYSDFIMFDSVQTMHDAKIRFDVKNSAVVSLGIDRHFIAKRIVPKGKEFRVGYLGSFAYHKNAIMVLKVAKLLKEDKIRFDIYGVGSESKAIHGYRKAHGLENVCLEGFAPESKKVEIYDGLSAFVFPSIYEGFGLPVLEAQARGLPVVAYRNGKISEEIRRYCFMAEDEAEMAQIIRKLKSDGYDEGRRKEAMAYARSFTWEKCAKETLKVYNKIL